jgi:hypothetical protein
MEEMVADTGEAKRKLKALGKHWPVAANDKILQDLGDFIATRFGYEQITARGFLLIVTAGLADLARGKDGRNNDRPIEHPMAGLEPSMYFLFTYSIPDIADAVFPPEFATEVRQIYDRVLGKNRKKK